LGQEQAIRPLRLQGLSFNGLHSTLTDNWVTLELTVTNPNAEGRDARVVVFYADQHDIQYARDVWVPPRSSLMTWMLVGPASPATRAVSKEASPSEQAGHARELQALIYDRTGNQDRLLLPSSEERVRTGLRPFRPKEPLTCILTDNTHPNDSPPVFGVTEPVESDEVLDLVRAFRGACALSENVLTIHDDFFPPTPIGFDGVTHFVLAGRRLAHDPPGQVALRRWLEQGGKLWVMLDRTDPDLVARILGGFAGFQVVDRTSLTTARIDGLRGKQSELESISQDFDEPVDFVRVRVGPDYRVLHTVNGWPASFMRTFGQGSVLITTLGARGWSHPRASNDGKSPYPEFPDLVVLTPAMEGLAQELQASSPVVSFPDGRPGTKGWQAIAPMVSGDIGYSVVGVETAGLMFGAFLLALVLLGIGLRRWRRAEHLGWLGPVIGLIITGAFIAVGETARRAIPPTVAVVQMVGVNPRNSEQAVTGLLGFYRPEGGTTSLHSDQGGLLDLDLTGLQGQIRRLVVTDIDAWHWEGLALPAEVRQGKFNFEIQTPELMAVVARFGPEGMEGKISVGPFRNLTDALIYAPSHRRFAARVRPDGTFTSDARDLLSPEQFIAGAVMSDQQQRRQAVYRKLLAETKSQRWPQESAFLAWADPIQAPFTFETNPEPPSPGLRNVGSALLSFPLKFEPTPHNTQVVIPRAFASYRRILPSGPTQPTLEALYSTEQHLRFQIPSSVLPLRVEVVHLFAKVNAPGRRFIVYGFPGGRTSLEPKMGRKQIEQSEIMAHGVELLNVQNPIDPIKLEIQRADVLRLDELGGLNLAIVVSDAEMVGPEPQEKWIINSLELEIVGRTEDRK
jgi:hypothetical protein